MIRSALACALALIAVTPAAMAQGGLGFIAADGPDGCVKTWIAIDRDGDGSVSRTDARLTTGSEYESFDRDGDGKVTREEWIGCEGNPVFAGVLPPPGPRQTEADPSALPWQDDAAFAAADANGDGSVTREEALAAERARFASMATGITANDYARASARRFLTLDADGDGVLTSGEWDSRADATVASRFARFDLNGNGDIGIDEWGDLTRRVMAVTGNPDGSIDFWAFYYAF